MRRILAVAALAVLTAGCGLMNALQPKVAGDVPAKIDPARLSEHVRILASDDFQGRGPASEGETKTVDYLIAQMTAMGLEPGGERGGWTQDVPMNQIGRAHV